MPVTKIQLRRNTASQWTTDNPILADGEPGVETDTGRMKLGNGSANWGGLSYAGSVDLVSLAAAQPFNVELPEAHGAVRDNTADDTAAITAAINAAVSAAVADGTYYAEVWFSSGIYKVSGALVQGGVTHGNAQIPLPVIAGTAHKVTLVLRGVGESTALPHWLQNTAQHSGAVIRTTLTGQTYSATFGGPSIIGGPTIEQGYGGADAGTFNNMMIVVDGLTLVAPPDPTVSGLDCQGIAEANIKNLGCFTNATPATYTLPSTAFWSNNTGATGLIMPSVGNNDNCEIGSYTCENWLYGLAVGEHTSAKSVRLLYCHSGLTVIGHPPDAGGSTVTHGAHIDYLSTEACFTHIYNPSNVGFTGVFPLIIDFWDPEDGSNPFQTINHVYDPNSSFTGQIGFNYQAINRNINITGARGLKLKDVSSPYGANAQSGSYTLAWSDAGRTVVVTSATPATVTIPQNVLPIDAVVQIQQGGAGAITISPASGVTLNAAGGRVMTGELNAIATLIQTSANVFALDGNTV